MREFKFPKPVKKSIYKDGMYLLLKLISEVIK